MRELGRAARARYFRHVACAFEWHCLSTGKRNMLERLIRHETIRDNLRSQALINNRWRDCAPPFTQPFTTITYRPPVVFSLLSHISSISDMSQFSSSSSTFQLLFDGALQDYKDKTGNAITDHPIARQLENANLSTLSLQFFKNGHGAFVNLGKMMESS